MHYYRSTPNSNTASSIHYYSNTTNWTKYLFKALHFTAITLKHFITPCSLPLLLFKSYWLRALFVALTYTVCNGTFLVSQLAQSPQSRWCRHLTVWLSNLQALISPHHNTALSWKLIVLPLPIQLYYILPRMDIN